VHRQRNSRVNGFWPPRHRYSRSMDVRHDVDALINDIQIGEISIVDEVMTVCRMTSYTLGARIDLEKSDGHRR